jgi:hypothetical protein
LQEAGVAGFATVRSKVGVPALRSVFHSHFPPWETPVPAVVHPSASELEEASSVRVTGTPFVTVTDDEKGLPLTPILATAEGLSFAGELMVTVTESAILPPVPVQVMVYVFEVVRLPVDSVPLVALVPVKPLEATQEVALVDVQVRDAAVPLVILKGPLLLFALMSTVGAAGGVTLTVTELTGVATPDADQHCRLYVLETVRFPVDSDPPIVFHPDQSPVAQQDVASVVGHVRVAAVLYATAVDTMLLFAFKINVGTTAEVTLTVTELAAV